jgi:hypothetical protein
MNINGSSQGKTLNVSQFSERTGIIPGGQFNGKIDT